MKYIKLFTVLGLVLAGMTMCAKSVSAQIPDIEGYILVSGTNAPVPNVWVKLTNDDGAEAGQDCAPGATDQSRYALTDANGKYVFKGWTSMTNEERDEQLGVMIDTNFNGSTDSMWYPNFSTCTPGESHAQFSCGHDPFSLEVVKPVGMGGSFDSLPKGGGVCLLCINNGDPTTTAQTLYYHATGGGGGGGGGATATPTPTSGATSGSVTLNAVPSLSTGGSPVLVVPSATSNVSTVTFTISNPSLASVCSASSSCAPGSGNYTDTPGFSANVQGFVQGTTTITVTCTIAGGGTCTGDSETITVTNASSWFQTKETDIITNGNIENDIPSSCVSPSCNNNTIIYDSNESPGVVVANNSPSSSVSQDPPYGWEADTTYSGNSYSYEYFEKKAVCGTIRDISNPVIDDVSDLLIGSPSLGNYYWVRYTGGAPLRIENNINLGDNKVVLFVKNTDLQINGGVTLNNGRGFFMSLVGSVPVSDSGGNIIVNPSVGGSQESPAVPDLEGVFFAQRQFRTGTNGINSDQQLHVRGSIAAFDRIVLQRSLLDNSRTPAELLEFGPDLLVQFPSCLGEQSVDWRELAP